MSTLIHRLVEDCRAGRFPRTIARIQSGWVVLGEVQFLRGYALILPDPVVPNLNALSHADRKTLLFEMTVVGDGLLELTGAVRINYEILGNLEPALHVHIFPRFSDEPEALRSRPVWFYDWDQAPVFNLARDQPLMEGLRAYLQRLGIVSS
ncbi:MAG: hypothetical protein HW411_1341 [Gammaproteobacteria bacterium]|nr:hypothetical protein [Gammaproteobacteria bacterium]MBM2830551.1 hypothetical protein [Gammaproteobacteria bacterium]